MSTSTSSSPADVQPVDLRDYVDFDDSRARRVRVYATPTIALDLWCLQPRQSTPVLHYDEQDVTYSVIGGRSWFVTEHGEIGLDAMGSMLVPAGTHHGIDNRAPDPLIVLAASAPPSAEPAAVPVGHAAAAIRHQPEPGLVRRLVDTILGARKHSE
ncbi:MAG: hypothetical protein WD576_02675 [Nitriliruptoraceae bacterium]